MIFTSGYKGLVITSLLVPGAPPTIDSFESAMQAEKQIILSDLEIRDRMGFPGTEEFKQFHAYNQTTSGFVSDLCRHSYFYVPSQDEFQNILRNVH